MKRNSKTFTDLAMHPICAHDNVALKGGAVRAFNENACWSFFDSPGFFTAQNPLFGRKLFVKESDKFESFEDRNWMSMAVIKYQLLDDNLDAQSYWHGRSLRLVGVPNLKSRQFKAISERI